MTDSTAAYGRAHAAITRITGDHAAASEVLATLGRLGWRWMPNVALEPEIGPAAPPPADWVEQRRLAREIAEERSERVRRAER